MHSPLSLDEKQFPDTARFMASYAAEKARGLIDVKFCPGNVENATIENFFAEANKAVESESVNDAEFF
jgi:hypothetical protein